MHGDIWGCLEPFQGECKPRLLPAIGWEGQSSHSSSLCFHGCSGVQGVLRQRPCPLAKF